MPNIYSNFSFFGEELPPGYRYEPTMNIQDIVQRRNFICPKCRPITKDTFIKPRFTENQYGTGRTVDLSIIFECHGERATYIVPNAPITRNAREAADWVQALKPFDEVLVSKIPKFPTYVQGNGIIPVECKYSSERIEDTERQKQFLNAFSTAGMAEDQFRKQYDEALRRAERFIQQKERELLAAKATGGIVRDNNGEIVGVVTGSGSVAPIQLPASKKIIRVADRSGWIAGEDMGFSKDGRQILQIDGALRLVIPLRSSQASPTSPWRTTGCAPEELPESMRSCRPDPPMRSRAPISSPSPDGSRTWRSFNSWMYSRTNAGSGSPRFSTREPTSRLPTTSPVMPLASTGVRSPSWNQSGPRNPPNPNRNPCRSTTNERSF
jgi:hypothetical protein